MTMEAVRPGTALQAATEAGVTDQLGSRSGPFDNTAAPDQVKRVVVHIVIGFGKVAVATKTDAHPWLQWNRWVAPYRNQERFKHLSYDFWDRLREMLLPHHEAGDEFAMVRLTGRAFNDPLSQLIAQVLMRTGLMVSNQTFMADDDTCAGQRGQRNLDWLVWLDDQLPGTAYKERAENYERRTARVRHQAQLARGEILT
jgi:hypothetical protein